METFWYWLTQAHLERWLLKQRVVLIAQRRFRHVQVYFVNIQAVKFHFNE